MGASRIRRVVALVACAVLVALAHPAFAPANRGLTTGFADDPLYTSGNPAERATWFDRTVQAKAGVVRIDLSWAHIVASARPVDPSNPASASYDFSAFDAGVRDAKARGLGVLLTIAGAPAWAEGAGRPSSVPADTWKPNPSDLADFAQAVAARYSGGFDPDGSGPAPPLPAIQALEIWNEPNLNGYLTPQYEGTTAVGAELYRKMLNASYAAVKAVSPQTRVVAAGAGPYGDPPGYGVPERRRARPVLFWQQLLCVHPVKGKAKKKKKVKYVRTAGCPAPVRFDLFGFHAINTSGGPLRSAINPNDASSADLDRVARVLRGAERAGTVLPGRHPIWTTEMWFDVANRSTVPLERWLPQALHLLWKEGASVVINWTIRDVATGNVGTGVGPVRSGIFYADGRPKPAFTAFRFPFVTERLDKRRLLAWGKAPAGGKLVIQRRQRGRWIAARKLNVGQGAVFTAKLPLLGKQRLRAKVAGNQSVVWNQR
jgi:hypothetical protein